MRILTLIGEMQLMYVWLLGTETCGLFYKVLLTSLEKGKRLEIISTCFNISVRNIT